MFYYALLHLQTALFQAFLYIIFILQCLKAVCSTIIPENNCLISWLYLFILFFHLLAFFLINLMNLTQSIILMVCMIWLCSMSHAALWITLGSSTCYSVLFKSRKRCYSGKCWKSWRQWGWKVNVKEQSSWEVVVRRQVGKPLQQVTGQPRIRLSAIVLLHLQEWKSPEELSKGRSERFSSGEAFLHINLLRHGRHLESMAISIIHIGEPFKFLNLNWDTT